MKKLILCKRLFTAETDAVLEDMAILLEGNLIAGPCLHMPPERWWRVSIGII